MDEIQELEPMRGDQAAGTGDAEGVSANGAKRSARDRAYERIRLGILSREFLAGTFVEEQQVCKLVGLSRTPVREAFSRLAAEGFIEQLPRRGAMVRHVTGRELVELYETRKLIEGHAVTEICRRGAGAPDAMRRIYQAMEQQTDSDILAHEDLNRRFHHALMQSGGNTVLSRLYTGLHATMARVAVSALAIDWARKSQIQAEHLALIEALDAGDSDAARSVLARHLEPPPEVLANLPR